MDKLASLADTQGIKDVAHISSDWVLDRRLIDGVVVREIRSVVTANSVTTEICRSDWGIVDGSVKQTIHVSMRGNAISAWHQHRNRWDYIFVIGGHLRVVLYDPREESPTRGQVDVFHLSPQRPQLLAVPPSIWHGVQNLSAEVSSFVNLFNEVYDYADPDEWRLPADTEQIPFVFR
jgi:dTDP-4-dehydrorhamnose 3,5-epimerase